MQSKPIYLIDLEGLEWWAVQGSNLRPPACKEGWRLPRFSPNSFLSLRLHGFGASAFARNAYA